MFQMCDKGKKKKVDSGNIQGKPHASQKDMLLTHDWVSAVNTTNPLTSVLFLINASERGD